MRESGAALLERPSVAAESRTDIEADATQLIAEAEQYLRQEAQPLAREVSEIIDVETAAKQRVQTFLGRMSLEKTVQKPEGVKKRNLTLAESIDRAVAGDKEAEKLVDANIASAVIETCFKEGQQTESYKQRTGDGQLVQYGLTTEQTQYNSLVFREHRPDELKAFTFVEALNGFREEELIKQGVLKDDISVVFSCVPDGLPEEVVADDGFFTDRMTFCLQGTTETEDGKAFVESVFNTGTAAEAEASYEERCAKRFDLQAIGAVYEYFGFKAPKTAKEMLSRPLVISRKLLPHGMVELLRLIHLANDALQGKKVDRPLADYLKLITESRRREASMGEVNAKVKKALFKRAGTFTHPNQAIELLWEVVKPHVVQEALTNHHIDPKMFGLRAATQVEKARYYLSVGDIAQSQRWLKSAERVASIVGCGGRSKSKKDKDNEPDLFGEDSEENLDDKKDKEDSEEDDIPDMITCPGCHQSSPKEKVVHEDKQHPENSYWSCPKCPLAVDVCTGKVMSQEDASVRSLLSSLNRLLEMAGIVQPVKVLAARKT